MFHGLMYGNPCPGRADDQAELSAPALQRRQLSLIQQALQRGTAGETGLPAATASDRHDEALIDHLHERTIDILACSV